MATGHSRTASNNYASSSKTDLSSLSSHDAPNTPESSSYGTFPVARSSAARPRTSSGASSSTTLLNSNSSTNDSSDTYITSRGRTRQRYTSGISLKGPLRLEKVDEHPPRLLDQLNPQLFLENAGCVARDHLASERTFLSYVRTSLATSMTGIVFIQLLSITPPDRSDEPSGHAGIGRPIGLARPLAIFAILSGIFTLAVGVTRYFAVQSTLITGSFKPSRTCTALISSTISALIVAAFGILMIDSQGHN